MFWCFAIVNRRLAEIFFEKHKNGRKPITGHCYVRKEEYKTKQEQKWIARDTSRVRLAYRKGMYRLLKQV